MNVTSFSRSKPIKSRRIKKIKYIYGDISVKKNFKILKKDFNYVVNLSGNIDHTRKKEVFKSHFLGVKNISDFCFKNNVKHFIQMGSSGEYGNAASPHSEKTKCLAKTYYNKTKLMASKYLMKKYFDSKLNITILRPYQVYGPLQSVDRIVPITITNCLKKKIFYCSEGLQFRDFLYVKDLVNAIFSTIENKKAFGEVINLGTGKLTQIRYLINKIRKLIPGGKPIYGVIPLRKDEPIEIYPTIVKAKKILKWSPIYSLSDGLKKTIKDYKTNLEGNL